MQAGRAYLRRTYDEIWRQGEAVTTFGATARAADPLASVTAAKLAAQAVDLVHDTAGVTAIQTSCDIERCWRDVHAMTQHVILSSSRFETIGRVMLGLDPARADHLTRRPGSVEKTVDSAVECVVRCALRTMQHRMSTPSPMSARTIDRYARPVADTSWDVPQSFGTTFRWEYNDGRDKLLNLYEKGKRLQWNAAERIDWSQDLDPENPAGLPDESLPIFGSEVWDRMTGAERSNARRHFQSWQLSQFLHGEQGALVCTAKIVQQVPGIDAKFYASTQVIDEARHVEAYSRLLHEKYESSTGSIRT